VLIDNLEIVDEARREKIGNHKRAISDGSYKVSAADVACKIVQFPTATHSVRSTKSLFALVMCWAGLRH
jgi:hypothetical protein